MIVFYLKRSFPGSLGLVVPSKHFIIQSNEILAEILNFDQLFQFFDFEIFGGDSKNSTKIYQIKKTPRKWTIQNEM